MQVLSKARNYLKASYDELKKVVWPTRQETTRYSLLVIAITLFVVLYMYVLDQIFDYLLTTFILG